MKRSFNLFKKGSTASSRDGPNNTEREGRTEVRLTTNHLESSSILKPISQVTDPLDVYVSCILYCFSLSSYLIHRDSRAYM